VANLIVDIGNTRAKVAVYENNEPISVFTTEELVMSEIVDLKEDFPLLDRAIVSSTKGPQPTLVRLLQSELGFAFELDHRTSLPITNAYETPHTLGKDRLASVVGANFKFPNENVLVIDFGTAITYDLIDEKATYRGGYITPGLRMRFQALNHFTQLLPLLDPELPQSYLGVNTAQAIRGGIQIGLEGELNQMIATFQQRFENLKIILTGGDANYFDSLLKNYNFATLETTLLGLNRILDYNQLQVKKN
jgi:type III pantothenate kinase